MAEKRATPLWVDLLWLIFLAGLAVLPPVAELHKQAILLAIGVFQLLEDRFIQIVGERRGRVEAVLLKMVLATALLDHTRDLAISSSYWPIFLLPVITAAMYFGPLGTLLWTTASSAAYVSFLIPALVDFRLDWQGASELMIRILFFFLVAMTMNRFVIEYRIQVRRHQLLSQTLAEANRNLQRAQEEARRAERLAALGQLSAGLAHEIRNPLGVIKGSAEILNQKLGSGDALAKELSGYIYTEVNRVSALVSRFLDFARPSQLDLRPAQVPEVVEKSIKAAEEQGATSAVKIVRDYAPNLPDVMLDEGLCEQAFLNLVLNACQAMGEAGGELQIRIRPAESNGHDQVVVEIEDSGPGVPADMKEQIFNPFVTTKKDGVGLGLAIVSKIIDAHGGSVQLIARQQQPGACFRVVIPVTGPAVGPVSGPVAGAATGAMTATVADQATGTTLASVSGQATGQSESASGHADS